jgi:dCMP deaminase
MMKWRDRYVELARFYAGWSKDPSTRVGAVIADVQNRLISAGYNGPPRGIDDARWQALDRDLKLAATIHAEANAILFAERDRLVGATLYVTHPPCPQCAALIAQAGISSVVYRHASPDFVARWGTVGLDLLAEAGVTVIEVPP